MSCICPYYGSTDRGGICWADGSACTSNPYGGCCFNPEEDEENEEDEEEYAADEI